MATKKSAVKKAAKKVATAKTVTVYRSLATGRAVSEKWALKNLDKVEKEVVTLGALAAALKKKTSRIVKRDTKTGEFAPKKSRKRSVTSDIVKAPQPSTVVKKTTTKRATKGGTRGG